MSFSNQTDLAGTQRLSDANREKLLSLMLEAERRRGRALNAIASRERREGPIPLSYSQERLWFLEQLGLVGTTYNMPLALRLSGILVAEALRHSFAELVRRHESLRTRFGELDGVPYEVIDPPGAFELHRVDLSDIKDLNDREQNLNDWMRREQAHRFDLRTGPLLRVVLVKLSAGEHTLLVTLHHIIVDGWSLGILVRELSALYSAYLRDQPNPLPELTVQYPDYAIWQRRTLTGEALEEDLRYWKQHLQGIPQQLQLPTDRARPVVESFQGAMLSFEIPATVSSLLKDLARAEGATLFMVALAAYQTLLARWSGQQDIVVGVPIAGRKKREIEGLIGFFVNTLALRTNVSGDVTFKQLLSQVKEMTLEAYAHQDLPFEVLVRELRPDRNLTRQPIFQAWLALQNVPEEHLELPGLKWSWTEVQWQHAHFDLTLYLVESPAGISATFEYATDLFDRETVERMAAAFQLLLQAVAANPDSLVHRLPLLSEAESQRLLIDWNSTTAPYPAESCLHELFEAQVRRTPSAVAVQFEGRRLTYAELDAKANQVAWYLRTAGIGPDQLVPICMERSPEMVIGLLAILKAGGAYVPLDPYLPVERLASMIQDTAPRVLLTQRSLVAKLSDLGPRTLALDDDGGKISVQRVTAPEATRQGLQSTHLAYVIYTSGSTGKPKGAMNEHRSVINRLQWMQDAYRLSDRDRVLQKTPFSFDVSVWEFFWTLLNGACLVVARPEGHKDPRYLQQLIEEAGITTLHFVPSMLHSFLDRLPPGRCATLRRLVCSGEELSASLRDRVFELLPHVDLSNLYGPTEAAIDVTAWECQREDHGPRVPIGRPIANTRMYVLDPWRQLTPVGVVGEIYIGGVGVGRGYVNRPELTAERFIPDLFSGDSRAHLYRTGDLGRWRPDGAIEYLGRNDHQVKIRGFRVELGEIEAQLLQNPQVKEAAVQAIDDGGGQKRLVAYIVGERQSAADTASQGASEELQNEVVAEWARLYEQTYEERNPAPGPNFVGWNSSYTGELIPESEMQEWLEAALARIRALQPKRVLEIGCGIGLFLQHLAPQCQTYVATEISSSALEKLRAWTSAQEQFRHVKLLHRSATELGDLDSGTFDTIVLNSVVQYFPDVDYLIAALHEAVRLLQPGGKLFLGDIRHLGLLPTFHSTVQLAKAAAPVSAPQLRKRIARAISQDKELALDPEFFHAVVSRIPGISAAEVYLKRGRSTNELMRYRYDVVLHTGVQNAQTDCAETLKWPENVATVPELQAALRQRRWNSVRLDMIPNIRLSKDVAAQKLIEKCDDHLDAGDIRRHLSQLPPAGVDPEELLRLAESCEYQADITWSSRDPLQCYQLFLSDPTRVSPAGPHTSSRQTRQKPWSAYASDPSGNSLRVRVIPQLREYLKARLPEYMLPSAWILLKQFPLTANGKLDRHALPKPEGRPDEAGEYIPPSTATERALTPIWAQVLQIDQIGVRDNFFELGGHSLHALRLLARIAALMGVTLPVTAVFQHPTIQQMAAVIESLTAERASASENADSEEGIL